MRHTHAPWRTPWGIACAAGLAFAVGQWPLWAQQTEREGNRPCRIEGLAQSGEAPLSGVSLTVRAGERVIGATSSDADGSYVMLLAPGAYTLRAELSARGFASPAEVVGLAHRPPAPKPT